MSKSEILDGSEALQVRMVRIGPEGAITVVDDVKEVYGTGSADVDAEGVIVINGAMDAQAKAIALDAVEMLTGRTPHKDRSAA